MKPALETVDKTLTANLHLEHQSSELWRKKLQFLDSKVLTQAKKYLDHPVREQLLFHVLGPKFSKEHLPASLLENYALRPPFIDEEEFEKQKDVLTEDLKSVVTRACTEYRIKSSDEVDSEIQALEKRYAKRSLEQANHFSRQRETEPLASPLAQPSYHASNILTELLYRGVIPRELNSETLPPHQRLSVPRPFHASACSSFAENTLGNKAFNTLFFKMLEGAVGHSFPPRLRLMLWRTRFLGEKSIIAPQGKLARYLLPDAQRPFFDAFL